MHPSPCRRCSPALGAVFALVACAVGSNDDGTSSSTSPGATGTAGTTSAADETAADPTTSTSSPPATGGTTPDDPTTGGPDPDTGVFTGESSGESSGGSMCGDGLCALDEDATSCCADCGVCSEGATVRMETGTAPGAPGVGVTPGGMADTHAQFAGGPFAEIVYPFTVPAVPVVGATYFWAQQFFFEGTDQGGYTGVQTGGIMNGQVVDKMMIFSIWDALEATPGPQAGCEPFGGEGIGYSCRLAFAWRENVTYRMILRESQADRWSLAMFDPATAQEVLLGDIRVPEAWGRLRPPTAGFAEYFGTVDSCETLPHAVALLHQPIADGAAPTAVDAGVYGTCAAQATSVCTGPLCL